MLLWSGGFCSAAPLDCSAAAQESSNPNFSPAVTGFSHLSSIPSTGGWQRVMLKQWKLRGPTETQSFGGGWTLNTDNLLSFWVISESPTNPKVVAVLDPDLLSLRSSPVKWDDAILFLCRRTPKIPCRPTALYACIDKGRSGEDVDVTAVSAVGKPSSNY